MPRPRHNIAGKTFGRLVVIKDNDGGKNPSVKCKCACGQVFAAQKHNVIRGNTRSCGCLRSELSAQRRRDFAKARKDFGLPKLSQSKAVPEVALDDKFGEDW